MTQEQLLQEARKEAEKVYTLSMSICWDENDQQYDLYKDERKGYIQCYIQQAEKRKGEAIEFAEWLSLNEWVKRIHTHPNKVGQYYSDKHCEYKPIEQLFDLFLQQQNQE